MTIDRTKARATNQNKPVEGTRDRIIREHTDLQITVIQSRKPPGMEGKCMRCGNPEHQLRQKCPAKNAKCKECHKIGHFHKGIPVQEKRQKKDPILSRHHPRMMMTPTLTKMESDSQIHPGLICLR